MNAHRIWFAGVDWARQIQYVRFTDDQGHDVGERIFAHGGEGLADMANCLIEKTQSCAEHIYVANPRLANAVYFCAKCAVRRDQVSKPKYEALRARGHGYARTLRSVADRLLNVACAMLRDGTLGLGA